MVCGKCYRASFSLFSDGKAVGLGGDAQVVCIYLGTYGCFAQNVRCILHMKADKTPVYG